MHKVHAVARRSHCNLIERRGNAAAAQQQRSEVSLSATRMSCARSGDAVRTPLKAVAFAWRPHGVYGNVTASLTRPHGASTAFAMRLHRISFIPLHLTEITRSCHGDHCAPIALPRSPSTFAGRLQGADTATTVRCELPFTKGNVIQATFMKV